MQRRDGGVAGGLPAEDLGRGAAQRIRVVERHALDRQIEYLPDFHIVVHRDERCKANILRMGSAEADASTSRRMRWRVHRRA